MKKKILILSIYYPPINSIASNRIYSFAKYLSKDKFNITILTIDNGQSYKNNLEDINLIRIKNNTILQSMKFHKQTNKFFHLLKVGYNLTYNKIFQDEYRNWKGKAIIAIKQLIKQEGVDLIISTYSPITPHLVALNIKKEYPQIKWIADMRDEMGQNPFVSKKEQQKLAKIEKQVLNYCDALSTVSTPILNEFKDNCKKNIILKEIRNGYDFKFPAYKKNDILTFVYTGTLYGNRKPDNIFKVLLKLKNKIDFRFQLVGVNKPIKIPEELKNNIIQIPKVSHQEALDYMINADFLLLLQPSLGKKGVYTGKIFEYIAMLKPILALIDPDDVAATLLRQTNLGFISSNDDLHLIEKNILSIYELWSKNKNINLDIDIIKKHHRKNQTMILETLIEELV